MEDAPAAESPARASSPPGFSWRRLGDGPAATRFLTAAGFPAPHGFSCRWRTGPEAGGAADLGRRDDASSDLERFAAAFGARVLHSLRQVHGSRVHQPGGAPAGPEAEADAAVVTRAGSGAAIKTADCVPILLADPDGGAVAGVHAGWRGSCRGVAGAAVRALVRRTGAGPDALGAVIGPAIGPCCFEVGPEVPETFAAAGRDPRRITAQAPSPRGRPRLDLQLENRLQLLAAGLDPGRIRTARLCTRCEPAFHSYRREGRGVGRNWALVVARRRR